LEGVFALVFCVEGVFAPGFTFAFALALAPPPPLCCATSRPSLPAINLPLPANNAVPTVPTARNVDAATFVSRGGLISSFSREYRGSISDFTTLTPFASAAGSVVTPVFTRGSFRLPPFFFFSVEPSNLDSTELYESVAGFW